VVPGGFSYGDYCGCGALAAKAPVMKSVSEAAGLGKPVLGNLQWLLSFMRKPSCCRALWCAMERKFIDKWVDLKLQNKPKWWWS